MKPKIIFEIVNYLAVARAGADKMSNDLRKRAYANWDKSKSLPRKEKKMLRKDAMADLQFAEMNDDFSSNLFKF